MIKKIEIKKWSTHFSVKIWEKEDQQLKEKEAKALEKAKTEETKVEENNEQKQ